jgi:hypothetical protein
MDKIDNDDNSEMLDGIVPVINRFESKSIYDNLYKSPIQLGTVPSNLFESRER